MALRLRRKKNPGHVECEPGFPCPQLPLHYENWRLGVLEKFEFEVRGSLHRAANLDRLHLGLGLGAGFVDGA
jgi:hypothetical protein